MSQTLKIRVASKDDAQPIAHLIQSVAHYFLSCPSGEGAEAFLASITAKSILSYVTNPDFVYLVGFEGDLLVGVAAIKDQKHIYHLFVHPAFQKRGVANRLWEQLKGQALAAGNPGTFTVNSSIYAVPVYVRFGFVPTSEAQEKNGIQFQPMRLTLER